MSKRALFLADPEEAVVDDVRLIKGAREGVALTKDQVERLEDAGASLSEEPLDATETVPSSGGNDKLTGDALEARVKELGIDASGMTADEKRAAVAEHDDNEGGNS